MSAYFSYEDLMALKGIEQKTLSRVYYNNWQNKSRPGDMFEFLDKLELHFTDGSRIVLASSETDEPGISLAPGFDAEKSRLLLLHEFGGKIDYSQEDMTDNPLWSPVKNRIIRMVGLVDDGENTYRNDSVLLDFGDGEMLEVRPGVEGLIVEPFEDV